MDFLTKIVCVKNAVRYIKLECAIKSNEHSIFVITNKVQPNANEIRRRSSESSVTIAYERSFRRVGIQAQPSDAEELSEFQFCGCGWPQHMLLPKGTPDGTEYDLFVMISDYDQDRVDSTNLYAYTSTYHIYSIIYIARFLSNFIQIWNQECAV